MSGQLGRRRRRFTLLLSVVVLALVPLTLPALAVPGAARSVGASPAGAQDTPIEVPSETVRVSMTDIEPFVVDDEGDPDGLYAEIWDEVAAELGISYEVRWVDTFGGVLEALDQGQADLAIAPLAATAEREASYDFTSAVVSSGPQLGYHGRIRSRRGLLPALFSISVLQVFGVTLAGLVVLGHLIWLVERNNDENDGDFANGYLEGVWDGFWWATVTLTTVGYGDKAPRSVGGRCVALLTMFLSLFLIGALVSQVNNVLSEEIGPPFTSLDELGDRPVGAIEGSSFADFVEAEGANVVGFDSQQELFDAVEADEIDALVTNPYALTLVGPRHDVEATGDILYLEYETFGVAQGSPWREPVNQALANLHASGEIQEILERWTE